MSSSIVVGCRGQDGSYLVEQLTAAGSSVVGLSRSAVETDGDLSAPIDLADSIAIRELVASVRPREIYYLAARHGSAEQGKAAHEPELLEDSLTVHVKGLANFLDAIRLEAPEARLLYAASAHVF